MIKRIVASRASFCFPLLPLLGLLFMSACSGHMKIGPGWEGEKVTAEGMVPYDGKDLPAAKAGALASAQRHAVEQVVGVFVSGRTQVRQAVAIQQKVLSRTQGFIKRYEILKEGREGDYWKTRIRAVVLIQDIGMILDELEIVRRPKIRARAVVIINGGEAVPHAVNRGDAAEQGVCRALRRSSTLSVIDKPSGSLNAEEKIDEQSAVELGKRLGADIIIFGNAQAYKIEGVSQLGSGFVPYRAHVTLRAVASSNGQLLAEASHEASGIDPVENISTRKALSAAGELAGQDIIGPLEAALKSEIAITVKVTSLEGIKQLKKLQDTIRNVGGVEEVVLERYTRGDADLSVYTEDLSGEELAASILRVKPFPLDTQSVSRFELVLKVR